MTMTDDERILLKSLMVRNNIAWSSGLVFVSGLMPDESGLWPFDGGWPCVILAEKRDVYKVVTHYLVSPLRETWFNSWCESCCFADCPDSNDACKVCSSVRYFRSVFWIPAVGCSVVNPDGEKIILYI